MKKKIILLICMLVAVLAFTGCAEKTDLNYSEEEIEQVTEFLIEYCASVDEVALEQWNDMTDFALEQQLTSSGLPLTSDSFLGALNGWQAGVKECGDYIGHDTYTFEVSSDELKVSTEAEFADRDATIEFVFDDKLYLDSMTISAHFSMGEILKKAGLNTLLGMGTVFAVLIFISLIISLFKYIPAIQAVFTKKPKKEAASSEKVAAPAISQTVAVAETDNTELIAVISAAIAAAEGTTTDGFVVRSIKRRKSNKWN